MPSASNPSVSIGRSALPVTDELRTVVVGSIGNFRLVGIG